MQVTPLVLVTSTLSQLVMTWAYKNPDIKWINKKNIQFASALVSGVGGVLAAYAAGTLDQGVLFGAMNGMYNAFIASGLSVAFYEWTKKRIVSE